MTIEGESPENIRTVSVLRNMVEFDLGKGRVKGNLELSSNVDPIIRARFLLRRELLEKGTITLAIERDNEGDITILSDSLPIKLDDKPFKVDEISLGYVVSGFLVPCRIGDKDLIVEDLLGKRPVEIKMVDRVRVC